MTVSAIASQIYQAAKSASKGVWNWRIEWSRAMKKAWRKVITDRLSPREKLQVLGKKIVEAVELGDFGMTLHTGLTSWEFGFIADNWNRLQRYDKEIKISPKQAAIIDRCYVKAA